MLAVPLLLGIAVTRPVAWDIVLGGAAAASYLASATAQAWARARAQARSRYSLSLAVYATAAAVLGTALVVERPALLLALPVAIPAAGVTLVSLKLGRARGLVAGLAQVAQALVLVPAAAWLAEPIVSAAIARATLLASFYLVGTTLAVRSTIREEGNRRFAAVSIGFHVAAAMVSALLLPTPYVLLLCVLAVRAAALPIAQHRLRGTTRPLRPIQVGMIEMALAAAVVILAFAAPIR